jgi:penicillin-binding protein 2
MEVTYSKTLRANLLAGSVIFIAFALIVRLFYMQVFQHGSYLAMSEENRIRIVPETAVRGRVLDRNGLLLIDNRPSYVVSAVPSEVRSVDGTAAALSSLLDIPQDKIAKKIRDANARKLKYEPVRLQRDLPFELVCRMEESSDDYPGVILELSQSRNYPLLGSASHLLGYLSEVTEAELDKMRKRGYHSGSLVGRKGIEKSYDYFLRGTDGTKYLEVTAEGQILGPLSDRSPVKSSPGFDLRLSVDYGLQVLGESLFGDSVTGAAVAIEPSSGAVLALVSAPGYDANLFSGRLTSEDWRQLSTDTRYPLLNRCIQATYPPGSIYKLMIAGAGLESGVINTSSTFHSCTGGYRFGNRVFKCHKPSGHGVLAVQNAIAASCDVFFYQLGIKLGLKKWSEYSRACGFGSKTGIELDDEASGFVPDKEYYNKRFGEAQWTQSLVLNLAIGQGELLVTPVQMAVFFSALVNGGQLLKPHILHTMYTAEGPIKTETEVLGELPFSPLTLAVLKAAMIDVVNGGLGTAHRAKVKGTTVAGKTGTAQNPHGNDHAWFVGYAPADSPAIVIACVVENAGHGGSVAAPIVSKMIERYLKSEGILPPDSIPAVKDSLPNMKDSIPQEMIAGDGQIVDSTD